jgi:hypothetical protein
MLSFEDDDVPGGSGYKDVTSVLLDAASGETLNVFNVL